MDNFFFASKTKEKGSGKNLFIQNLKNSDEKICRKNFAKRKSLTWWRAAALPPCRSTAAALPGRAAALPGRAAAAADPGPLEPPEGGRGAAAEGEGGRGRFGRAKARGRGASGGGAKGEEGENEKRGKRKERQGRVRGWELYRP